MSPTDDSTTSVDDCLAIGTIVNSNSHMDYTVEIFNERDRDRPPEPHERGFGQPVFIRKTIDGTEYAIMGVIYDTVLVDPDQGRSGPRLAQDDQPTFTPGYVEERTTLAGVALLGYASVTENGTTTSPQHRMPQWTLSVDDFVYRCPNGVVHAFHIVDEQLQLAYLERLRDVAGSLGSEVTLALIERLRELVDHPDHQRVLNVIEKNIRWQSSSDSGVVR